MQKENIRKAIKIEAKNKPKKSLALSFLILIIISILITATTYFIISLIGYGYNIKVVNDFIIGIILTLISPLILSFSKITIDTCKNKKTNFKDIFKGYKETKFIKTFGILILSLIFIMWLLGLIPGVGIFINLVILILYMPVFIMLPFVYLEYKDLQIQEIIFKTVSTVSEHRIMIYGLLISFIFWIILSLLTFGILFFYIIPYMYLSIAYLYLNITHEKEFKKEKAIGDGNVILIFIIVIILAGFFTITNIPGASNILTTIINGEINTKVGDTTLSYGGVKITYNAPKNYKTAATTDTSNTYLNYKNNNILQYTIYLSKADQIFEMDKEIVDEMKASGKKIKDKEFTLKIDGKNLNGYEYVTTDGKTSSSTITVYYPKGDFTIAITLTSDTDKEFNKNDIKEFITIYWGSAATFFLTKNFNYSIMKIGENMKNKGFTLVELLGVIVILGIIGTLVTPLVINLINEGKEDVNNMQIETVKRAAKNYANAHVYSLADCDNCVVKELTIGDLKNDGFLEEKELKEITSDNKIDDSAKVQIRKENGKYKYIFPVK